MLYNAPDALVSMDDIFPADDGDMLRLALESHQQNVSVHYFCYWYSCQPKLTFESRLQPSATRQSWIPLFVLHINPRSLRCDYRQACAVKPMPDNSPLVPEWSADGRPCGSNDLFRDAHATPPRR